MYQGAYLWRKRGMLRATARVALSIYLYLAADSQVSRPIASSPMKMRNAQPSKNSPFPISLDLLPVGINPLTGVWVVPYFHPYG